MSLGVYPVARPVMLCGGSPSEERLHAVKRTVVSVWPFQWGTFSPPKNRAKKQDVNLEPKRKKRADKCHHYATISTETARPTPTHAPTHTVPQPLPLSSTLGCTAPMCDSHIHTQKKKPTANGMAEARINAASLLELWWKLNFSSVGMFLPQAAALTVMRFLKQSSSKHWSWTCCPRKEDQQLFLDSLNIWKSPWVKLKW